MDVLRPVTVATMCFALVSCHGASDAGQVVAGRYEQPVRCEDDACYDEVTGAAMEDRSIEGFAFLTSQEGDDVLVYAEFLLDEGAGYLEIDAREREGEVHYVEFSDAGEEIFRSAHAVGTLEIPADPLGEECGCITGRFELRLWDPGADEELGTRDDLVRHLATGRYSGGDDYCEPRVAFPVDDRLELRRVDRCPVRADRRPGTAAPSEPRTPSSPPTESASCDGSASEGCESGSSSGCESDDSASCESDGGSSGSCEGDDSASCDGDSSSTCESVAGIRLGGCRAGLGDGRLQLILFVWLALWTQRRRAALYAAA